MIDFGMPSLLETKTLDECATLCSQLKLNFIELNMNLPQYQLNEIEVHHFKKASSKYGIYYTIHLDENLNIGDFNPYIADGSRRTVMETIELAKALDIPVINMHLSKGVYFTLPDKKIFLFSEYKDQYLKSIIDFRDMCEKAIGDSGIIICIENCDAFLDFQKTALELILESSVFALTFDIGHDHSCGGVNESYIVQHKDRLHHMHMHDALGTKKHLTLGTGEIDLEKYLNLAKETGCRIVLETKTAEALKKSVDWIRNFLI